MPSRKVGGKPTSSDVAAAAGVSRSAVSFAFNNPQRISAATRERILAAAAELGYTPNTLARMLQAGTTNSIGVLLGWQPGAVAALTCSINGESRNAASITGTEGRIDIPPGFFVPREFTLTRAGKAPETFQIPFEGNGYQFEAAEVQRCILAGELESPLMPHTATLEIMTLLDAIREEIGVSY